MMRHLTFLSLLLCLGCESFDSPPKVSLFGTEDGTLEDPTAPVTIEFHEPYDTKSLKVKIVTFETDPEGNLFDEDDDPATEVDVLFAHDGSKPTAEQDTNGIALLDDTGRFLSMTLNTTLPIGPALAIVIEPGLSDDKGNKWEVRQRIVFGYQFSCAAEDEAPAPTLFPSATHFMLVDVEAPVAAQLQLVASMVSNAETGDVVGQFTNGDRDPSSDCGMDCGEDVCRTLPQNECVRPSQSANTPDEYPDFFANADPPTGYSFTVKGCVKDQEDGTFTFANAPVDVMVTSPPITVKGINFNGAFGYDTNGVLRGAGTFSAQEIFLGETPSGAGAGTIITREIPAEEIKPGTPEPPADAFDTPAEG